MYTLELGGISNNYATFSFSGSSTVDTRTTRNFEDLITERGNEEFEKKVYHDIFEKIREKLFISSEAEDIELIESERVKFTEKYNINSTKESINNLKREIAQLYVKKTEHELLIQERRQLFDTFCTNISNSIKSISDINNGKQMENDIALKDLLDERIEWYYDKLELNKLVDEEYSIKSEFYFLKKTLQELSGISSATVCPICMENQVAWFIDPCGHALCDGCKTRTINVHNCHYCRATRNKFNRLYL